MCGKSKQEMTMKNTPMHIRWGDADRVAVEIAAKKIGLTVSGFVRSAALKEAAAMGIHAEQPKVE
jgi:uncharacterized protein (DUF1778 family)